MSRCRLRIAALSWHDSRSSNRIYQNQYQHKVRYNSIDSSPWSGEVNLERGCVTQVAVTVAVAVAGAGTDHARTGGSGL